MSPRPKFPKGNQAAAKPAAARVSADRLTITGPPGFRDLLESAADAAGKPLQPWIRDTLYHFATAEKARGEACIDCGTTEGPMVPVAGMRSAQSDQVFRCVECAKKNR